MNFKVRFTFRVFISDISEISQNIFSSSNRVLFIHFVHLYHENIVQQIRVILKCHLCVLILNILSYIKNVYLNCA